MADYFPPGDKRRDKNLKDFHGKTPREIKESRWYHGTVRDFGEFKPGRAQAIFLTKNPQFANEFASQGAVEHDWDDTNKIFIPRDGAQSKPNVMPVHVRAENPFDYQNKKHMNALIERLGPQLISDPFLMDMMHEIRRGSWDAIESAPVQQAIKKMGHDSFYVNETGEKNLAVYNPAQIKSATGNRGTYDPNDPDITKAEGGGITAYHGSPYDFDQFDISKVGSGDGAQAYGHGLYFAANEPTAIKYRDYLSKDAALKQASDSGDLAKPEWKAATIVDQYGSEEKAIAALKDAVSRGYTHNQDYIDAIESGQHKQISIPKGHMYQVAIQAHPDHMLDWDKPLDQQPYIMQRLVDAGVMRPDGELTFMYNEAPARGGELYERLTSPLAAKLTGGSSQKHASEFLHSIGIKGIKYLDSGPRSVGKGSNNYVVFNHDLVGIKRKYARGGIVNA